MSDRLNKLFNNRISSKSFIIKACQEIEFYDEDTGLNMSFWDAIKEHAMSEAKEIVEEENKYKSGKTKLDKKQEIIDRLQSELDKVRGENKYKRDLIVRDIAELDEADIEDERTVCVNYEALCNVVTNRLLPEAIHD